MSRNLRSAALSLLIGSWFLPAPVSASGVVAIGYGNVEDLGHGLELEAGFAYEAGPVRFSVIPLGFISYLGERDPNYREETFNNGQTVCRDTRNGQFADGENCDPPREFGYAPSARVEYRFTDKWGVGAGVRAGEGVLPFALVSHSYSDSADVGVRVGPEYQSVSVAFRF